MSENMSENISESSKMDLDPPKVVALIGALMAIRHGIYLFWSSTVAAIIGGVLILILGLLLFIAINVIDFKIEPIKKLYDGIIIIIIGLAVFLIDLCLVYNLNIMTTLTNMDLVITGSSIGWILIILAGVQEKFLSTKPELKVSKTLNLLGALWAILESVLLIASADYYHGVVGIIVAVILLIAIMGVLDFIPYEWWLVLILGFILMMWVSPAVGGVLVLLGFMIRLTE